MAKQRKPKAEAPDNRPSVAEELAAPAAFSVQALKAAQFRIHLDEFEKDSRRDEYGRFKKGVSGNPGGIPRAALDARRAFAHHLPRAIQLTAAMMESGDPEVVAQAVRNVLGRALGKEAAPAELPTDEELPPPSETSPQALLDRALRLVGRNLSMAEKQVEGGQPLTESQRAALRDDVATLSAVLKASADNGKQAPGAELSDEELTASILSAVPLEKLRGALVKREEEYRATLTEAPHEDSNASR